MPVPKDERNHILRLVEQDKITAAEAAQLLDTLELEYIAPNEHTQNRIVRVRATNTNARRQRAQVTATIPLSVMRLSLRLGSHLLPQLDTNMVEDLMRHIEHGSTGRLLDVQDIENGERIEIFVE